MDFNQMNCFNVKLNSINIIIIFFLFCIIVSCSDSSENKEKEDITHVTAEFASHYFNFDLNGAVSLCTRESGRWISFMASNIMQEDIDVLRSQDSGATYDIGAVTCVDDTSAVVECRVFNFLKIDTIGQAGKITRQATYEIPLVKRNGKWLVKMEGLLQSERQNPD